MKMRARLCHNSNCARLISHAQVLRVKEPCIRATALRHSGGNGPVLVSLIRHVEQAHRAANKGQRLAAHCSGQSLASVCV